MTPEGIERWRRDILQRLDVLKTKARHARQFLESKSLDRLEDKEDLEQAWRAVYERFPEDLRPVRGGDLGRHLSFAEPHDFSDIENVDVPSIVSEVERYGRRGDAFIQHDLSLLDVGLQASELLHPQIRDVCGEHLRNLAHKEAARAAIDLLIDEIRKMSGRTDDGDALIRSAVGAANCVGFSENATDSEKNVTEGMKLVLQGMYKGVRHPSSHPGFAGFERLETFQILAICSLLLSRLRINA
jgi:uncharacterized protein (TIGR02391 family)